MPRQLTTFLFSLVTYLALTAQPVTFNFECVDGQPGETVCVNVVTENFIDVAVLEFTVTWDPTVLDYNAIQNEALNGGIFSHPGPLQASYIWVESGANNISLPDGTVLFEICFDLIGLPGTTSPVGIASFATFEVANNVPDLLPTDWNACQVDVSTATNLAAFVSSCGPQDVNGTFDLIIFGGTPPYNYTWTNTSTNVMGGPGTINTDGGSASESIPPGNYDITITDMDGNMVVYNIDVDQFPLFANVDAIDPTCANFTNGKIIVEAADGNAPYEYYWESLTDPGLIGSDRINADGGADSITSLPIGQYSITLTDENGCDTVMTVDLTGSVITMTTTILQATCLGALNGRVTITPSGGHPNFGFFYDYLFLWNNDQIQSGTVLLATLDPGDYCILLTDSLGCTSDTLCFVVPAANEITADIQTQNATCIGQANGTATISGLTNGSPTGSYDYEVYDSTGMLVGNASGPSYTINGLAAGEYGAVIFTSPCRSDTITFTIGENQGIIIDVIAVGPDGCIPALPVGSIEVQATGGFLNPGSDYTYSWAPGALMGSTINDLNTGSYMLLVTDDNGCSAETTVMVPQGVGPDIDSVTVDNVSCNGDPTAMLTAFVSPGSVSVLNINWSGGGQTLLDTTLAITGDTVFTLENLGPGEYFLFVSDSLMCFRTSTFTIDSVDFRIESVVIDTPSCPGDTDGQITVNATGGVNPYTYFWSTGDTTQFNLLPGLLAGEYSVTITDAEGCVTLDTTVIVPGKPILQFSFSNIDSVSCPGTCDGIATLTPSGGLPGLPYQFFWASGEGQVALISTANMLCEGWQSVIISQDNLCFFEDSVFIPAPDAIFTDSIIIMEPLCAGGSDGSIRIVPGGGTSGYSIEWESGNISTTESGLTAGLYAFTITDAMGCIFEDTAALNQPDPIVLELDSFLLRPISCGAADDGAIAVSALGGLPGTYSFQWDPGVSISPLATGLGPGTYGITVTDGNGCMDSISATLTQPQPVEALFPPILDPACNGGLTFISVNSATGGVGGAYTYSINNGQQFALDSVVAIPPGFYTIFVFDSVGCSYDTMFMIDNPPPIEISVLPQNPVVNLGDSTQLTLSVDFTQNPIIGVQWTLDTMLAVGPNLLSCGFCYGPFASNVNPTTYTVTVIDSAGCFAQLDVFVGVDDNRQVYIPNVFSPNRDGVNDDFKIFTGPGAELINYIRIFDRWGGLVFQEDAITPSPSGSDGWDGTMGGNGGEELQPGVYAYMVEIQFKDGSNPLIFRGDITLVR